MSLWDAEPVPSRIIGMIHTALLLQADSDAPVTRETLEKWMAPRIGSERENNPIFREVFSECKQLGLLVEAEQDNGFTVHPAFNAALSVGRKAEVGGVNGLATITELVRERVRAHLAQSPTPDSYFCRLLAWTLMQNGSDLPLTTATAERLSSQQDPERNVVGFNPVRYGAARFWMVFLGFGWQHALASTEALQPDPTAAFGYAFARWMQDDPPAAPRVALSELLRRMALAYPWVENGEIAAEVRDRLVDGPVLPEGHVNDTTALALLRLERKGVIELHRLSDAVSVWTLGWGGPRREVSHIEWKGKGNIK